MGSGGRDELPAGVYTWLMPVRQAIDRAEQEAQKAAGEVSGR